MRIGILGGGQLGQMMVLAGYPIGVRGTCFDSSLDVPAGMVGPVVPGELSDSQKLRRWASLVDVITYEFENFPAELVGDLSELKPVHPSPTALAAAQDRLAEKRLFNDLSIPVTPFRSVDSPAELTAALGELEMPVLVKTRTGGYDGKGQVVVRTPEDVPAALQLVASQPCIAEQWVPFDFEVSVIGVRGMDGSVTTYPITKNEHRHGILHKSTAPAAVDKEVRLLAQQYVWALLDRLDYVGVLTLELFVVGGRLLANEMAPRVHNSGHWTIEGAETSQFENHVRAICGLPLGSTRTRGPVAMINLVGAIPRREEVLAVQGAHLHLYGKDPRPGRKLGHITVTAGTEDDLTRAVKQVEDVVDNQLG